MNIIFKRKSKSVPNLKKTIYSKIQNNCLRQPWKTFLKNELELSSILHELSKAEFDIRNQDKFKYTARSILMMKRQVIKYLEQNQLQQGKKKLKQLYAKINYTEMKKIGMMIIFLQCREQLQKSISSSKEENIIHSLKIKMSQNINGNQISLIKIKILTILSILLLRFHGILMTAQQKHIIFKTIELKKKKMLQMDIRQQRQSEFQCLLYLLLQLYKILYLLKKDQQTILFYYNQLHAYTQIYITRQENKKYLDVNELNKILLNMKPALNQLDIYEDSKLRKNLAFAHIQQQIIQQENQSGKILSIKKEQQNKVRISSSIKLSSSKQLNQSIRNDKRLTINYISNSKDILKQQPIESVLQIQKNPLSFSFLVVSQEKLYKIFVKIIFRNGCNLIDIDLCIKCAFFIQNFKINGISLAVIKLSFRAISQFLQKVISYLFPSEYYFRQMHNLYFADEFLPQNIDVQNIITSMARMKTQIGQYLRQNNVNFSIIGPKFNMPIIDFQELMIKFNKQLNEAKAKDKLMVRRRQGIILQQNYQEKTNKQICIKTIIKRQHQNIYQYCLFNIFFQRKFKGIQIYYLQDNQQEVEMSEYINNLKKLSKNMILNQRIPLRNKIITSMFALQNKIQRPIPIINTFKVQQELQINQEKLQPKIIKIQHFNSHKQKSKQKKSKIYELVKTAKMKYYLFVKQIESDYIIYKSDMVKLFLPLNWREYSWKLVKRRFRMYQGMKILNEKCNSDYFIKTYKQDNHLMIKQQLMLIKFIRHRVIRKKNGYCMLLEYETNDKQFLYEIIINKQQRYYYLRISPISNWQEIVSQAFVITKYPFQLYQGIREKISQANWYYMHVIKSKNKKMASRKYLSL